MNGPYAFVPWLVLLALVAPRTPYVVAILLAASVEGVRRAFVHAFEPEHAPTLPTPRL